MGISFLQIQPTPTPTITLTQTPTKTPTPLNITDCLNSGTQYSVSEFSSEGELVCDSSGSFCAYKKTKVVSNPMFYFDVTSSSDRLYFTLKQEGTSVSQSAFYYKSDSVSPLNGWSISNLTTVNVSQSDNNYVLIKEWSFQRNPYLSDFGTCIPDPSPTPIPTPTPTPWTGVR